MTYYWAEALTNEHGSNFGTVYLILRSGGLAVAVKQVFDLAKKRELVECSRQTGTVPVYQEESCL